MRKNERFSTIFWQFSFIFDLADPPRKFMLFMYDGNPGVARGAENANDALPLGGVQGTLLRLSGGGSTKLVCTCSATLVGRGT